MVASNPFNRTSPSQVGKRLSYEFDIMTPAEPTVEQFDELLGYLSVLYGGGFKPIRRWGGGDKTDKGVFIMPWPEYEEAVRRFYRAAAKQCWADHDYISKNVGEAIRDPQRVACATLEEIESMLSWCVHGERFCDGHWGRVIEEGCLRNILVRLRELRPR